MIALAAALALGGCTGGLCHAHTLDPFFAKLARLAPGTGGKPVHILQIGDSHTAGDAISGAWRDLLQQRYGSGGRGVLAPGRPYQGYLTHGVTVSASPGWSVAADFGGGWSPLNPPLGLSAYSLTSPADGATMSLVAEPTELFDRMTVCGLAKAGAGSVTIRAGSVSVDFDLGSPTARPACRTVKLEAPAATASLEAHGGPVTLTSWATFRDAGGVALSNLGVVGSQLIHFARTDDAVVSEELRAYQPDLIVLAFGTNEGFSPHFTPFEYEITLRTQIGRLRRLAGNVPILMLGAPDALSRRSEMRGNAPGAPAVDCGAPHTVYWGQTQPADQSLVDRSVQRIKQILSSAMGTAEEPAVAPPPAAPPPAPAPIATGTAKGSLFPPAGLAAVREVQRRVAASLNVAFWDWEARMGGRCTADAWVHATPPLMRGDYVHYTSAGGREIAQRLQADLDKAAAQ